MFEYAGQTARPETAVRGGEGAVSASIRRRRVGCLDRPPRAALHRRSDGAPASPLRYSASRACRTSFAGTPRASRHALQEIAGVHLAVDGADRAVEAGPEDAD